MGQGTHVWIGKWEIQEIILSRVWRGMGNGGRGMGDERLFSDVLNPTAGLHILVINNVIRASPTIFLNFTL